MLKSLIISPRGGLETEGLFEREEGSLNLVKIMVAVHKELECAKVQKPKRRVTLKYSLSFKNKMEGWGWLKRGEEGLKNFLPLEGGGRRF